ncbi:MAG: hypothetical protein AB8B74_05255 [Crocinitomicaceae bacterium]
MKGILIFLTLALVFSSQFAVGQKETKMVFGDIVVTNNKTNKTKKIGSSREIKCWDYQNNSYTGDLEILNDSTITVGNEVLSIDSIKRIRKVKVAPIVLGISGVGIGLATTFAGAVITVFEFFLSIISYSNYSPIVGPIVFFSGAGIFTTGLVTLVVKKNYRSSKNEFEIVIWQ